MTKEELERIKKYCAAATKGPLQINRFDEPVDITYQVQATHEPFQVLCSFNDGEDKRARADAEFFIAAISDLPLLVEALKQAWNERDNWEETAAQYCRNQEYYAGLLDKVGETFGELAYIADDGTRSVTPLRAKLPEVAIAWMAELNDAIKARDFLSTQNTELLEDIAAVREERDALKQDVTAYRGSLGYPVSGDNLGLLSDGTRPNNGIAEALSIELNALKAKVEELENSVKCQCGQCRAARVVLWKGVHDAP